MAFGAKASTVTVLVAEQESSTRRRSSMDDFILVRRDMNIYSE
jgi:hypothetical protein